MAKIWLFSLLGLLALVPPAVGVAWASMWVEERCGAASALVAAVVMAWALAGTCVLLGSHLGLNP